MKNIHLIKNLAFNDAGEMSKDIELSELFHGPFRRIVESCRSAAVRSCRNTRQRNPITVLCLSGSSIFKAGSGLDEELSLSAGTLLTLEAGVEHEVAAATDLHLLVTKFKSE